MTRVSVIVPARDCAATIGRTLEALRAQDLDEPFEVIVVDDGSSDGTAAIAEGFGEPVRVVRAAGRGAAAARNLGAAQATGTLLAFTDADCEPTPAWLSEGVAALEQADLVLGPVAPVPDVPRAPFDRTLHLEAETGFFETANLLVRRDIFERLGGFEEWIDVGGGQPRAGRAGAAWRRVRSVRPMGEDTRFGWRARRARARIAFNRSVLVHHAVFRRSAIEFVSERARLRHMPLIFKETPELRRHAGFAYLFLNRRTAAYDAALAGALLALRRRTAAPLLLALPYLFMVRGDGLAWTRTDAVRVGLAGLAADSLGFGALVAGSFSARTLVI